MSTPKAGTLWLLVAGMAVAGSVAGLALWSVRGQSTSDPARDAALIAAAGRGDTAEVDRLLAAGARVTATDARGVTPLIAAAYGNHLATAEALITAGADVNVQDETRQSAYLITTADGYLDLLRLTLRAGADVHRTDSYNGTGLIRAAD